jgi:hypothetical protein
MGGCVMVVFNHGTPSLMPLELEELSIVMCDDQGFCGPPLSNMDFVIHPNKTLIKFGLEK